MIEREAYMREYRNKNKDKIKKLQHEWYLKNKSRVLKANRDWCKKNRKRSRELHENSRKNHLSVFVKKAKRYRKKYPEKIKAHNTSNRLLKCFKKPGFEFHHPDYSKPLEIEILPTEIHRKIHSQIELTGGE